MAEETWMDCSCAGGYVRVWACVGADGKAAFVQGEVAQGRGKMGSTHHIDADGTADVKVWERATGLSWPDIRDLFEMGAAYDRDPEAFQNLPPYSWVTRTA
jgi:hypothetical protein